MHTAREKGDKLLFFLLIKTYLKLYRVRAKKNSFHRYLTHLREHLLWFDVSLYYSLLIFTVFYFNVFFRSQKHCNDFLLSRFFQLSYELLFFCLRIDTFVAICAYSILAKLSLVRIQVWVNKFWRVLCNK